MTAFHLRLIYPSVGIARVKQCGEESMLPHRFVDLRELRLVKMGVFRRGPGLVAFGDEELNLITQHEALDSHHTRRTML